MILDDDALNIRKIKVDESNREYHSIDRVKWKDLLNSFERKYNAGCAIIFFLSFFLLLYSPWLTLAINVLGFAYKKVVATQYSYLEQHSLYDYEVGEDRLVRYTSTNYEIFLFEDIIDVSHRKYGLVLWKEKNWLDTIGLSYLKPNMDKLVVFPSVIKSYPQLGKYIMQQYSKSKEKNKV